MSHPLLPPPPPPRRTHARNRLSQNRTRPSSWQPPLAHSLLYAPTRPTRLSPVVVVVVFLPMIGAGGKERKKITTRRPTKRSNTVKPLSTPLQAQKARRILRSCWQTFPCLLSFFLYRLFSHLQLFSLLLLLLPPVSSYLTHQSITRPGPQSLGYAVAALSYLSMLPN